MFAQNAHKLLAYSDMLVAPSLKRFCLQFIKLNLDLYLRVEVQLPRCAAADCTHTSHRSVITAELRSMLAEWCYVFRHVVGGEWVMNATEGDDEDVGEDDEVRVNMSGLIQSLQTAPVPKHKQSAKV